MAAVTIAKNNTTLYYNFRIILENMKYKMVYYVMLLRIHLIPDSITYSKVVRLNSGKTSKRTVETLKVYCFTCGKICNLFQQVL